MKPEDLQERIPESEFIFSASRSSGPGGQNVNKVNTSVELRFNVKQTTLFSEKEKQQVIKALKNRINNEGELVLVSQSERTQYLNKKKVTERFYILVSDALTIKPERIPTHPTKASDNKRLEKKKRRGTIKKHRKDTDIDDLI